MKKTLLITLFMLATLAWAAAQQPGSAPDPNSGQSASPSAQTPGQSQPPAPGAADQAGAQGQASSAAVTEGCLGGAEPNYTITDKAGTAYKLNMPANANTSSLKSHIGESVQVQGDVKDTGKPSASIDVQRIGRGSGTCSGSGSNSASPNSANPNSAQPDSSQPTTPPPPKQ
jgi:hypothetical protein